MPVLSATTERVIDDLISAYQWRKSIPLSTDYPQLMSRDESYFIQDQVAGKLQDERIRAWKVGASGEGETPYCAPILSQNIYHTEKSVSGRSFHERGMESELCFVLNDDLPPRDKPYSIADMAAAIGSVEVVMELVDSRLENWRSRDPFLKLADNQMNGALIVGESIAVDHWSPLDFSSLRAEIFINDELVASGKHVLDDPIGSLPWLANHLAERQGGLRRGDRIITGSWTGMQFVDPDAKVRARFEGVGQVEIDFSAV